MPCWHNDKDLYPRICDIYAIIPSITGKIELVYEGEQEGAILVAQNLIGKAINKVFLQYFPEPPKTNRAPIIARAVAAASRQATSANNPYELVLACFSSGKKLELADDLTFDEYRTRLNSVGGLKEVVKEHFPASDPREALLRMELVLEGLHHNNMLAREEVDSMVRYGDVFSDMLRGMGGAD